MTAAEVGQLYIGIPASEQPLKQLRGFAKKLLEPGEAAKVTFELTRKDLSVWDVEAQDWKLPNGQFKVYIGKSVLDIQLTGDFTLATQ